MLKIARRKCWCKGYAVAHLPCLKLLHYSSTQKHTWASTVLAQKKKMMFLIRESKLSLAPVRSCLLFWTRSQHGWKSLQFLFGLAFCPFFLCLDLLLIIVHKIVTRPDQDRTCMLSDLVLVTMFFQVSHAISGHLIWLLAPVPVARILVMRPTVAFGNSYVAIYMYFFQYVNWFRSATTRMDTRQTKRPRQI